MKIENPAALRFIMQDDIYLLPTDKTNRPAMAPQPVLEAENISLNNKTEDIIVTRQPVVETKTNEFNYSGNNKKRFLIITNYASEAFMAAEHMTALENILKRKEHSLDDVAIFNRFTYPDADFEDLNTYFNPQKLLLLGKNALPAGIPELAFNQPQKIKNYDALYTFSFDEMMDNTANKKAFWDQMKTL